MIQKVLINREDILETETELQNEFILSIIDQMGVPLDELELEDAKLTIEQKRTLRDILDKYAVFVSKDVEGNVKIYVEKELIATWNKCKFVLKQDLSEIDPRKRMYIEMEIDCWSVFETEQENTDE